MFAMERALDDELPGSKITCIITTNAMGSFVAQVKPKDMRQAIIKDKLNFLSSRYNVNVSNVCPP